MTKRLFAAKSGSDPATPPSGDSYAYKASLVGSAMTFELTADGLAWRVGRKSGVWPYQDIAAIRLSYRPVSMQSRRFRADIVSRTGERVVLLSTSWQTVALVAPQDQEYRAFIFALHQRLAAAGGDVTLTGGLGPRTYAVSVAFLAVVIIALAGLLARAVATAQYGGMLFIVGFAALFGWQIGGFIRRNKPRRYSFDALPLGLLP